MKKNIFLEIIGWYGTVAIVLAYALLSFGILNSDDLLYQILNGTGALGVVLISLSKKTYQPAVLNIIWTIIAIIAIINILI
jgi:heme/copper-type cytochrome/quinol oxidase subunit 2